MCRMKVKADKTIAHTRTSGGATVRSNKTTGWRRCSKELPKVIKLSDGSVNSVLVYKKNGFVCGSDIQVSNTIYLRKHPKWVTHWMPLPEPPNSKTH